MTERKFTDEEVIKALELCYTPKGTSYTCAKCPFHELRALCKVERDRAALDLINRQRAEIERLQKYNTDVAFKHYNDGIKEFAERLKEKMNNLSRMEYHCDPYFLVSKDFIDKTAKELTEDEPCAEGADCSTEEGKG